MRLGCGRKDRIRRTDLKAPGRGSGEALEGASTARVGPPLPRRERAALLAERDGGAQACRPSEPAAGARPEPEPATAAGPRSPGRDCRPRGAALSVGEPAGPKPDGATALGRHPGAFAWQVSVARIPNLDKSKVCSDTNYLCISSSLFHNFYTSSPQSYPHFPQRGVVGKNRLQAGFRNSAHTACGRASQTYQTLKGLQSDPGPATCGRIRTLCLGARAQPMAPRGGAGHPLPAPVTLGQS